MRQVGGLRSAVGGWRRFFSGGQGPQARDQELVVDSEFLGKLDRLSLALGRDLIYGLMGEHRAQRRTTGIEFADYRQYSPGDDLRRVDWNAYARLGTLHVRQSQAEHDTVLYLLLDASPSMEHGEPSKFLAARRLAAALGYIALTHLDDLVIAAPGAAGQEAGGRRQEAGVEAWEPGSEPSVPLINEHSVLGTRYTVLRGRAESGSLFRALQGMKTGSEADFDDLLGEWGARRGQGRIAVVISDLLLDGYQNGVRRLIGAGFQVTLLHVLSPDELQPPDAGDLELLDSETGRQLEIHLGDETLAEYKRRLDKWLADTAAWCRANATGYLLVRSDWDVERVLLDTLRRRGVTA